MSIADLEQGQSLPELRVTPDKHLPHRTAEEVEMADLLIRVLDYCGANEFDIEGAVAEKRAYNRRREDHTIEARRAAGGKKF
jgi:hypothetical protein